MLQAGEIYTFKGVPRVVLSLGGRDCLRAGDTCSSDDTCSPRLRTLRQCVAGDGSVKLGPGARSQCENAMTALLSTPLHGCQCKRGMKKEKNCLSIYWSLHQSVLHGLSLVESFPYEPEERGSDYVRLASIAADKQHVHAIKWETGVRRVDVREQTLPCVALGGEHVGLQRCLMSSSPHSGSISASEPLGQAAGRILPRWRFGSRQRSRVLSHRRGVEFSPTGEESSSFPPERSRDDTDWFQTHFETLQLGTDHSCFLENHQGRGAHTRLLDPFTLYGPPPRKFHSGDSAGGQSGRPPPAVHLHQPAARTTKT
ncbi:unnamed protein product [Pleuronectes platessa]|uniref:GDNF/GAS1 domain-containing protein n=1 Tax=Pleuronectes platessa TaxID=8262 RepID=A0A9N7UTP7_PLEPL|nr:unnamed protein product [Pleuronectes platessa]